MMMIKCDTYVELKYLAKSLYGTEAVFNRSYHCYHYKFQKLRVIVSTNCNLPQIPSCSYP